VTARLLTWLRAALAAMFWLQADYPAAAAPPSMTVLQHTARRALDGRQLARRRILALYHEADAPVARILWDHGWPAYT
jgi:hypothetical protein